MTLSCEAFDDDFEPGVTVWQMGTDYEKLSTIYKRKCCSCENPIAVGDLCVPVERWLTPNHEIEVKIYGEDGQVPRAKAYMCESCSDLAFSLGELGFCILPWEDQRNSVKEYADLQQERQKMERHKAQVRQMIKTNADWLVILQEYINSRKLSIAVYVDQYNKTERPSKNWWRKLVDWITRVELTEIPTHSKYYHWIKALESLIDEAEAIKHSFEYRCDPDEKASIPDNVQNWNIMQYVWKLRNPEKDEDLKLTGW